jgi:mannose-6-phosphate isomerase-like protein (cupin superfamily)
MEDWQDKVWGRTRIIVKSDMFQRHQLEVNARSFCSVHWHEHRSNKFIVVSGVIRIVEFYAWTHVVHVLTADMEYDVPSLVPHQFQVAESGKMFEDYWPDRDNTVVDNRDIVRLYTGNILDDGETFDQLLERMPLEHKGL